MRLPHTARAVAALGAAAPSALLGAVLVAAWAAASARGAIPAYLLPSPAALVHAAIANASTLLRHAAATTTEALGGFALGAAAGLVAAVALSLSKTLRESLFPFALASQAVPIAAITPLIVLLVGRGGPAILTVVALAAFFPMLINATRGLSAADADARELMHSLAASRAQRLWMVELPGALPFVFAACKIGAASSFITAMVGEWIGSNVGLGYLVVISGQYFKIPLLWAAILTTAALTLAFVGCVTAIERIATPWARPDGAA